MGYMHWIHCGVSAFQVNRSPAQTNWSAMQANQIAIQANRNPIMVVCEQAHLWVRRASDEEQSDPAGRSLVKRRQLDFAALVLFKMWVCSQAKYYFGCPVVILKLSVTICHYSWLFCIRYSCSGFPDTLFPAWLEPTVLVSRGDNREC